MHFFKETLRRAQSLGAGVLDIVLPPRCGHCRTPVSEPGLYCPSCWRDVQFLSAPWCTLCGFPFAVGAGEDAVCAGCMAAPPSYDWARAPFAYAGPVRADILRLKHGRRLEAAVPLGRAMAMLIHEVPPGAVLVPVPLHRSRLASRRFNQSFTLAVQLSKRSGLRVGTDMLHRRRDTPSQAGLGRKARARNVAGAFAVTDPASLQGQAVLLVDDVMTTGATLNSAALAFKKSGSKWVGDLSAARSIGKSR